ncbi:MAG: TRCF domain-containing protein, partial [Eggerthella lenta]
LGSGMRIAMRDLEIRGAGNLLGAEQSGNMSAVGFDLFAQMLNQAVSATREGDLKAMDALPPALSDITVNVPGHTYLPEEYVPDADERVLWYRRIASAATEQAVEDVRADLADKRPDMPQAAEEPVGEGAHQGLRQRAPYQDRVGDGGQAGGGAHRRARDKMTGLRRAGGRYLADKRKLSLPLRYFKLDEGDNLLAVAEFLEELAK